MDRGPTLSRRMLLFGSTRPEPSPACLRPPWALDEAAFSSTCTRCNACIEACPEHVLVRGSDGLPLFDPVAGECTFCHACADACEPRALLPADGHAWEHRAQVAEACLPGHGIVCASCADVCPEVAIRIPLAGRGTAQVDVDRCTGCGACIGLCPVDAISLTLPITEAA